MPELSVNIDHVATIRNARYRADVGESLAERFPWAEPDPVRAAHEAEMGGAAGITVHLREDRRHIRDHDVERLRELVRLKFNLEMAATDEMVEIARRVRPHTAMLVPEGRDEVTTEGGLDVARQRPRMREVVARLKDAGLVVSAFIDAEGEQIDAAAEVGFDVCEVHTGPWAEVFFHAGGDDRSEDVLRELERVRGAGAEIRARKMRFNAGHALNYANVGPIARLEGVGELHIGHAIVSRASYVGLREAVSRMREAMRSD
ncbi:MAG: pyridoxine 5'-phosphate synthase [Planctomycetota bacterium]